MYLEKKLPCRAGKGREIPLEKILAANIQYWDIGKSLLISARAARMGQTTAERIIFQTRQEWEKFKNEKTKNI
jgi:hypothetical protein